MHKVRFSLLSMYSKLVVIVIFLFVLSLILSIQTFRSYSMGSQKANQLLEYANDVKYYDQILSHDALVGSLTGDTYHTLEYEQTILRLDNTLNEILVLDPERQGLVEEINEANRKLIQLERKAFELSQKGETELASQLILSDLYADYKLEYALPLTELIDVLHNDFNKQFELLQINLYQSIALIFILLGLVVVVLATVYYRSHRRTQLEHLISTISGRLLRLEENQPDEIYTTILNELAEAYTMDMVYLFLKDAEGSQHLWTNTSSEGWTQLKVLRYFIDAHPLIDTVVENHDAMTHSEDFRTFLDHQKIQRWIRINANPKNHTVLEFGLIALHQDPRLKTEELGVLKNIAHLFNLSINQLLFTEVLYHQATTDSLTGIHNRRRFMERMDEEILRFHRFHQPFCLMMLDIDYFKRVNDTYGHLNGDHVLKDFAKLIQCCLRDVDILGRYGGEEFCVLLTNTNLDQAMIVAERIHHTLQNHSVLLDKQEVFFTASIGITEFHENDTIQLLLDRVDQAMYHAKEQGRNRIVPLEP